MFEAEVNSGFTAGGDINISAQFTEITLLHRSSNGYSEVYKAKRYGQWHVLKCLTKEAAKEIQYQTLLEKEFRIAYPLSHPNIIRTLGIEEIPELGTCIIQEFIDGEPITTITREQAVELCEAVQYLHDSGIIHRDIKPENILVRKDNKHIILIDFGLADKAEFSILKGGAGTTGYAAPEQWSGELSPAVDVYGIGGVLALNKHFKRIAAKCRRNEPNRRYISAQAVKKAILRKFPWIWLVGIAVLLFVGWYVYSTFNMQSDSLSGQEAQLETLQNENALLRGEIDSITIEYDAYKQHAALEREQIREENESKLRAMQFELEREHNANIRIRQSINPLNNTPSSYHTAEDQRY